MSFSCPSTAALKSWIAALRLALWEKTRLEEIYTGHLLRMSLSDLQGRWKEPRTTLLRGRMEGEVKVRLVGQTEWKSYWAVVTAAPYSPLTSSRDSMDSRNVATSSTLGRRSRMSSLFSSKPPSPPPATSTLPSIAFYASEKPKDRKKPVIILSGIRQAFAVYPERVELINVSTLIKVTGTIRMQDATQGTKGVDGWLLLMPHHSKEVAPPVEMTKWIVGGPILTMFPGDILNFVS
jgi:CCR4-NOT transcriptional complex subunit CAF120